MSRTRSPSAWGLVAAVVFLVIFTAAAFALPLHMAFAIGPLWILIAAAVYHHRKKAHDDPLRVLEARILLRSAVTTTIMVAVTIGALYALSQLLDW